MQGGERKSGKRDKWSECVRNEKQKKMHRKAEQRDNTETADRTRAEGLILSQLQLPPLETTLMFSFPLTLISHQAYTLSQTLGSELLKLCSPAKDSLVTRPQLLMKDPQSERKVNKFPPKPIPIPDPD